MKKRGTALLSTTLILFPLLSISPVAVANGHKNFRHDRNIVSNWKDYYKGTPSFKLKKDPTMARYNELVEQAEKNVEDAKENIAPFNKIINNEQKNIVERNKKNSQLNKEIIVKTKERVSLATKVKSLEGQINLENDEVKKQELKNKLNTVKSNLIKVDNEIIKISNEKQENIKLNKQSKTKIANANKEVALLRTILAKYERGLNKSIERKQKYKKNLVLDILDKNNEGSRKGHRHAIDDADELAIEVGELYGTRDGARDGEEDGMISGRDKVSQEARANGDRAGATDALERGTETGRNEGLRDGNYNRGKQDGSIQGIHQAQNSDAQLRGSQLGKEQGSKQAQINGLRDGTNLGEAQAISSNESKALQRKEIDGAFIGAFARTTPVYPTGRDRGGRYNNRATYKLAILKEAYKDGYHFTYNRQHRRHFNERVEVVYESFYSKQYQRNFNIFENMDYPQVREESFQSARTSAYNRDFPGHRSNARAKYERIAFENPDKNGSVYKEVYESERSSSYSIEYSSIKEEARIDSKDETYQAMYPVEKEISRKNAHSSTDNTYKTAAVLKLESIEVEEVGIDGVGSRDGIVQPNENKTINIKVSNFGNVAKKDVKVLVNGVSFSVPSIPARTTATIKAVAKSQVNGTLKSRDKDQVVIVAKANGKIEARHFSSISKGILSSQVVDNGLVQYPLELDHLALSSELIRGKSISLRARVSNKSNKKYSGVKVILESDTDGVIKKGFSDLNNFSGAKTIGDSIVSVTKKSDSYSPILISAYLEKNGVIVGDATNALSIFAKEAFDNSKKVVVATDSHHSLRNTKDLIQRAGGIENVALLDTSIRSANQSVLTKGLENKAVVIDTNGDVLRKLRTTLKKSKNTALISLSKDSFQNLTNLSEIYKNSTYAEFNIGNQNRQTGIRFANPRLNKNISSSLPIISASKTNFTKELEIAKALSQSNDNLLSSLKKNIKESNFFNGNAKIEGLVEGATIKSFDEIMQVNGEYIESIKIFGDKDIADKVNKDKALFHNKLNTALGSKAKTDNIGLYMFASEVFNSLNEGLNKHKQYKKIMREAVTKRLFTWKKGIFGKKRKGALSEIEKKLGTISKVSKSVSSKLKSSKGQHKPYNLKK